MSNVIQLCKQKKVEDPADPETTATIAVAKFSNAQLARSIKELSIHIEALDRAIDAISDTNTRRQLKRMLKLACEGLTNAILKWSQEIRRLALYLIHDIKA